MRTGKVESRNSESLPSWEELVDRGFQEVEPHAEMRQCLPQAEILEQSLLGHGHAELLDPQKAQQKIGICNEHTGVKTLDFFCPFYSRLWQQSRILLLAVSETKLQTIHTQREGGIF